MKRVLIIGIGAGDPEQVTVQAIRALNEADVFFVIDKGADKQDLMALRQEICERYVENESYRMVHIPDPARDRTAASYRPAVEQWRRERAEIYERLITGELGDGECGAFLVRPGASRAAPGELDPGRQARAHHHRPPAGRGPS